MEDIVIAIKQMQESINEMTEINSKKLDLILSILEKPEEVTVDE